MYRLRRCKHRHRHMSRSNHLHLRRNLKRNPHPNQRPNPCRLLNLKNLRSAFQVTSVMQKAMLQVSGFRWTVPQQHAGIRRFGQMPRVHILSEIFGIVFPGIRQADILPYGFGAAGSETEITTSTSVMHKKNTLKGTLSTQCAFCFAKNQEA